MKIKEVQPPQPEISEEELGALDDYLNISPLSLSLQNSMELYGEREVTFIFPAFRKLIEYGLQSKKYNDPQLELRSFLEHSPNRPKLVAEMVIMDAGNQRKLLADYREDVFEWEKHLLFSKKISDMTGYEYEEYLNLIGRSNKGLL